MECFIKFRWNMLVSKNISANYDTVGCEQRLASNKVENPWVNYTICCWENNIKFEGLDKTVPNSVIIINVMLLYLSATSLGIIDIVKTRRYYKLDFITVETKERRYFISSTAELFIST